MPTTPTRISPRPGRGQATQVASRPIEHVVLIIKENHGFDNDFGTYPGANGLLMPPSPNPPQVDPSHTHATWWKRDTKAVRQQFQQADIPAYFAYAKQFTLCDNYFTDMAGPSTPNHLMLITAASPIIANPSSYRLPPGRPLFDLPSLPMSLEKAGLSWANYGGYPFAMIKDLHTSPKHSSQQFAADASAGQLPTVSWVNAPHDASEHAPDPAQGRRQSAGNALVGNVSHGMQWTVDEINAIVKGGLWSKTAIFITWDNWGG